MIRKKELLIWLFILIQNVLLYSTMLVLFLMIALIAPWVAILRYMRSKAYLFFLLLCPFAWGQTLQQLIDATPAGDTLVVNRHYSEYDVTITQPIVLLGRGGQLDAGHKGGGFIVQSDGVEISGMHIVNIKVSHTQNIAAIYLDKASDFVLKNNWISDAFFGILIEKSGGGEVFGNTISGVNTVQHRAGNGIHGWYCSGLKITDNTLFAMRDGIYFEFVSDSQIKGNLAQDNLRYGLHFMFSNKNSYVDNIFDHNGSGVAVMFSSAVKMQGNTFSNAWGAHAYGLLLKEVTNSFLINNRFVGNTIAIQAEGLEKIDYRSNDFIGNGWAVKFRGACYTNVFTANNFIDNSYDIAYSGAVHNNEMQGNYWSKYRGYDLDHDKRGDIPYRPVLLSSVITTGTPETLMLNSSLFMSLLNTAEDYFPILTPKTLIDNTPLLYPFDRN